MKKKYFLFLITSHILFLANKNIQAQVQLGNYIDGEAINDFAGYSVNMPDAHTMAIGAPYNDANGNDAGHVRVYRWYGNTWQQKGNDIDGEASGDKSGHSVSMPDSNTLAIGAPYNNGNGNYSGHVRVFYWDGSSWQQKGNDIDGEATNDRSGYSVSMADANTISIGAPYNSGNTSLTGQVRVFHWNGSEWEQKGNDIDGEALNDRSGWSVSMPDSNTFTVGAPYNEGNGVVAGSVKIYSWDGHKWMQKGNNIDGEAHDGSGSSVSMPDAGTVAIGAYGIGLNGYDSGHVKIYHWNGNSWEQKGNDINGKNLADYFGWSVSMPDSNTFAAGAIFNNNTNGTNVGNVSIYYWDGNSWQQKGNDIDGESELDYTGSSVSMPDANTIAFGAPWNDKKGTNVGRVKVYIFCSHTASTIFHADCNSYLSPSGKYIWTSSGTYLDTIRNVSGCDSIITINLTIRRNTTSNISQTACDSYTSPSGKTWNSSNIYYDTIPNQSSCDSIIEINLTILKNTFSSENITACKTFVSPSGKYIWTKSGMNTDTIQNQAGCDSIIGINLVINNTDLGVTQSGNTLTANAINSNYQWLDCNQNFAIISGETNQQFIASINGDYAVSVTQNDCTDTSICYTVTNAGINNKPNFKYSIYPNPCNGIINIDVSELSEMKIYDGIGKLVLETVIINQTYQHDLSKLAIGIYYIQLLNNKGIFIGNLRIER